MAQVEWAEGGSSGAAAAGIQPEQPRTRQFPYPVARLRPIPRLGLPQPSLNAVRRSLLLVMRKDLGREHCAQQSLCLRRSRNSHFARFVVVGGALASASRAFEYVVVAAAAVVVAAVVDVVAAAPAPPAASAWEVVARTAACPPTLPVSAAGGMAQFRPAPSLDG